MRIGQTSNDLKPGDRLHWLVSGLIIVAVWAWVVWSMLIGEKSIGFRDSITFYYPLQEWIVNQIHQGESPLWLPHEMAGIPLAGEASAGLFYPPKLMLLLPVFSFAYRYNLFLVLHLLLACTTAKYAAAKMGCTVFSSTLAALSYGLGGPVLFQMTNQIYLLGAAWLPLAVVAIWQVSIQPASREILRPILLLSFACSMMILGGDIQLAYVSLLLAAATGSGNLITRRWQMQGPSDGKVDRKSSRKQLAGLLVAAAMAVGLSAIQMLPAFSFSRYSERTEWTRPRSVLETVEHIASSGFGGLGDSILNLVGEPVVGTHHEHIYQFSQAPWSVIEFLLPGVSGTPWPHNTRWLEQLPGADRMWNVTLYQGFVPFVLAAAFMFFHRKGTDRWLILWTLFFTVAAWGWYGPGWALHEVLAMSGSDNAADWWGAPVGGLYWFLVTFVPGMVEFRYPAKLCLIATLGIALLAAKSADHWSNRGIGRFQMIIPAAGAVVFCVLLSSGFARSVMSFVTRLESPSLLRDHFFGPVDAELAMASVEGSIFFVAVICGFCFLLAFVSHVFRMNGTTKSLFLVLIVAVDLCVCQTEMLPMVDMEVVCSEVESQYDLDPAIIEECWQSGYRLDCGTAPQIPAEWITFGSIHRLEEIIDWQKKNLIPRLNLPRGLTRLGSFSSLQPNAGRLPLVMSTQGSYRNGEYQPADNIGEPNPRLADTISEESGLRGVPRVFAWKIPVFENKTDVNPAICFPLFGTGTVSKFNSEKSYRTDASPVLRFITCRSDLLEVQTSCTSQLRAYFPEAWCGGWDVRIRPSGSSDFKRVNGFGIDDYGPFVDLPPGDLAVRVAYFAWDVLAGCGISAITGLGFLWLLYRTRVQERKVL